MKLVRVSLSRLTVSLSCEIFSQLLITRGFVKNYRVRTTHFSFRFDSSSIQQFLLAHDLQSAFREKKAKRASCGLGNYKAKPAKREIYLLKLSRLGF